MAKKSDTRRFTIEITAQELAVLVRAHTNYIGKVTKLAGREVLKARAASPRKATREVQAILDAAEGMVEHHAERAKELQALLKA
jgi:hypothetical protein